MLGLPHHLGQAHAAGRDLGKPSGDSCALGRDPELRFGGQGRVEDGQTLLVDGDGSQPGSSVSDVAVEGSKPRGRDAKGTRGATLGSHPVHRLADAHQGLGRGHAPARVREPLDRLLELSGALACALGSVDAEAVVTKPRGRAENRLVDAQMETAGGDRAPAAQLVGQLGSPELEHLDGLLTRVEAPGHPDAASVVELVRQGKAVASSRPWLVARPVAAIDRATLAACVDAVQRPAHRTEQRRLA